MKKFIKFSLLSSIILLPAQLTFGSNINAEFSQIWAKKIANINPKLSPLVENATQRYNGRCNDDTEIKVRKDTSLGRNIMIEFTIRQKGTNARCLLYGMEEDCILYSPKTSYWFNDDNEGPFEDSEQETIILKNRMRSIGVVLPEDL